VQSSLQCAALLDAKLSLIHYNRKVEGGIAMELTKKHGQRIINYVNGALIYYGIIDAGKMHELTCQNLQLPIDVHEFNELMRDAAMDDDDDNLVIRYYKKYLFNYNIEDPQEIIREQNGRQNITYRPLTEDEALAALPLEGNSRRNKHLAKLISFIKEKSQTAEEAAEIAFGLETDYNNGMKHMDLIRQLLKDLVFDKEDEIALLMNMLNDYFNHIPQWALKGWTADEVFQRFEKPELATLPAEPSKQLSLMNHGQEKVGRNDPCPCGSGKKYKKCCLGQQGEYGDGYIYLTPEELVTIEESDSNQAPVQKAVPRAVQSGVEKEREPTTEEWANLYAAANELKAMKCWEWMHEDEIFGVRNPETNEVAYVSIMGEIGRVFAIHAYLGSDGLESFYALLDDSDPDEAEQTYLKLNCLTVSFEDRQALNVKDLETIKSLGLKFRGKNQWPQFRTHRAGYLPWPVNAEECRFLRLIIEQAMNVADRCRNSNQIIVANPDQLLIRTRQGTREKAKWLDIYSKVDRPSHTYSSFHIDDELALRKMVKLFSKTNVIWEADTFFMLNPIVEKKGDRPYLPTIFLVAENDSGRIIGYDLITINSDLSKQCFEKVVVLINRTESIPKKIVVKKEELYYSLLNICQQFDIELKLVKKLQVLPEARKELSNFRKL